MGTASTAWQQALKKSKICLAKIKSGHLGDAVGPSPDGKKMGSIRSTKHGTGASLFNDRAPESVSLYRGQAPRLEALLLKSSIKVLER